MAPLQIAAYTGEVGLHFFNKMLETNIGLVTYANENLYAIDQDYIKIVKFNSNGTYMGWFGQVESPSGMSANAGCAETISKAFTPSWCKGGTATSGLRINGAALDKQGNLYTVSHDTGKII